MSTEQPAGYPRFAVERGRVEPSPRRVRAFLGEHLVVDTTAARYVWEVPYYPQYYVPVADVRTEFLRDEDHAQRVQFGPSRTFSLVAPGHEHASAVRVFDDGDGPVAGLVRIDCDQLSWFEEDEPIYGHPRNPYARVDALRSHRHVTASLNGVTLADTTTPVLLFETGLPTRYYVDKTDVRFEHLEPSKTSTLCPYKGVTTEYWSVRTGHDVHADLAWCYHYPLPAVGAIAGMVAFYDEKVDVTVDGVPQPRPSTHFE